MKKDITLSSFETEDGYTGTVELACECPICGTTLVPEVLSSVSLNETAESDDEYENKAFLINYCSKCDECFLSRHIYNSRKDFYSFHSSAPVKSNNQYFSENIQKLSPDFVSVYNDSLCAEKSGLLSICGMGYRKSLEFLIKDYALYLNPSEKERIIKSTLSSCINQFIKDERLRTLATASTWIGNDETHYVKKHPDYGIEDQKIFINAFVTFIDSELAYFQAKDLTSISRN